MEPVAVTANRAVTAVAVTVNRVVTAVAVTVNRVVTAVADMGCQVGMVVMEVEVMG
jgi:hypothetical protein